MSGAAATPAAGASALGWLLRCRCAGSASARERKPTSLGALLQCAGLLQLCMARLASPSTPSPLYVPPAGRSSHQTFPAGQTCPPLQ